MKQDTSEINIEEDLSLKTMTAFTLPIVVLTISTQIITYYLMYFYTDVVLLPAAVISAIFLFCRIYDAANDIYFGFLMSKLRSKHGLYRPYILWTAVPLAVTSVLLFWSPDLSMTGKIIYVITAYFIWNTIESFLSVALNALFPLVAINEKDRVKLNSFRIASTTLCILLVSTLTMPLVKLLGGGDLRIGFFLTLLIFSLIGLPLQLLGFRWVKEKQYIEQKGLSFLSGTKIIMRDKSLVIVTVMYLFFWIASTFRNQSIVYYMTYVLKKPEYISAFLFVAMGVPILMQFTFPHLVKILKPSVLTLIGLIGSIIGNVLTVLSGNNFLLLLISTVFFGITIALPANLVFILYAKKVDELSSKNNVNLSSMIFSFMSFFAKIGIGIGGAGLALVLAYVNFVPNAEQTNFAALGITFNFIGGNIIGLAVAAVCMLIFIKLEKGDKTLA